MTILREIKEMSNRRRVFLDRAEAGRTVGGMLRQDYSHRRDVIVLGIPMGGVPVALEIRSLLACPMDLVIVRKIQIPGNPEAGFGAVTSEGDVFFNEPLLARLELTDDQVERQTASVKAQISERVRRLRKQRPFPALRGKCVLLVDDGLASGFTMKAAVHMVQQRKAAKTVVAVPTAPRRSIDMLDGVVDEICCPNVRDAFSFAVADAYAHWYDLTEAEVAEMLGGPSSREDPFP